MYINRKYGTLVRATIVTGYNSEKCDWEIDFMNGKTIIMPDKDFREQYGEAMVCPCKICCFWGECVKSEPFINDGIKIFKGCVDPIPYIPEQKEQHAIPIIDTDDFPKPIEQSNLMLSPEQIYQINGADTEDKKRHFKEAGLLDICNTTIIAELNHLKGLGIVYVRVEHIENNRFGEYVEYHDIPLSDYKEVD